MADSFPTSSGKFEFVSPRADEDGVGRLPHFVAPLEATRDEPETVALIAPANHHFLNSVFANRDFHQTKAGQSRVAVNPDDADRFGLVDGEMTRVSNHRGYFDAVVEVSEAVRVGTAATTKGRWLDADGRGVNSVSDERDSDMGRGAVYHDMRVTLSPQPI